MTVNPMNPMYLWLNWIFDGLAVSEIVVQGGTVATSALSLTTAVVITPALAPSRIPSSAKTRVASAVEAAGIPEASLVAAFIRIPISSPAGISIGIVRSAGFTLAVSGAMSTPTAAPAILARLTIRIVSGTGKSVAVRPPRRAARPAPVSATIGGHVGFTLFHGPSLVYNNFAVSDRESVHFFFGRVSFGVRAHLDEPKTLGPARQLVCNNFRARHSPTRGEHFRQLRLSRLKRQAPNIKTFSHKLPFLLLRPRQLPLLLKIHQKNHPSETFV